MADHITGDVDARLGRFLTSELARAEADFERAPIRPLVSRHRVPMPGLAVVTAIVAVALLGSAVVLRSRGPGGPPLGSDGVPLSIDGQAVLRGDAIAARLVAPVDGEASFLAGGFVVLHADRCPAAAPSTGSVDCGDGWRLETDETGSSGPGFPLMTIEGEATFVHTSGAATVFRVETAADVTFCGPMCPDTLLVRATVWRQPTKGPIPDGASPAEGGETNLALVPDFVSAVGPDGETIVGYVRKDDLFGGGGVIPGSPSDPPQVPPMPVYGEDLVTVIGQMVPGAGFVAVGASVPPVPSPPIGNPSTGPSASPAVVFEAGIPVAFDGESVLAGADIDRVIGEAGGSLLVTGKLGNVIFDCFTGSCPESATWVLQPPGDIHPADFGHILLDAGRTWSPPSKERWPGDLVVLRVRAYDLECPWDNFCANGLRVETWIPAP